MKEILVKFLQDLQKAPVLESFFNKGFRACNFMKKWRKIINIYNDFARKYGNVTVKDFRQYEKLGYINT